MGSRTTSTTGIGVRQGTVQLGGLALQPIPYVLPSLIPNQRQVNPVSPAIAPAEIADAIRLGNVPVLTGPALNVAQIQTDASSPAIRLLRPGLLAPRAPNEETLSLANVQVANGQFIQADPNGLHALRPEILSLMDYEPIYFGNSLDMNDVGVLMDVQYQSRHLREQTFLRIVDGVQTTDQAFQIPIIQSNFVASFQRITIAADFYRNTIITLENIKGGFNVKNISPRNFDVRNFTTLRNYFQTFMLFPQESFDRFSNTKIMMQLLFDIRSIAEGYSMNLLNVTDPDRESGGRAVVSPVNIDKSYNPRSGFSFTYDTIRSFDTPVNASEEQFFTQFNSSLPQSQDDRIKILMSMFSKEIRVSRGLGRPGVQSQLSTQFGATTTVGSPFDNLLGGIGNTIFDPVVGEFSIASLMTINNVGSSAVLPFEVKYIDVNNTSKVYVPGSSYFVDSIINTPNLTAFNTDPLRLFVEKYVGTVETATDVISNIFDFSDQHSRLSPQAMMRYLMGGVSPGLAFLKANSQRSGETVHPAEAATVAMFRQSVRDPVLKRMLFQYMLGRIILRIDDNRFFANAIIDDMDNLISGLSFTGVTDADFAPRLRDLPTLQHFLVNLMNTIQHRVIDTANQRTSQGGSSTQSSGRSQDGSTTGFIVVGFDTDRTTGIPAALEQSVIVRAFVNFIVSLESVLGNEAFNLVDTGKRTRFNTLSISTLVLMAFEVYVNFLSRYASSDFQTSESGDNFPDMLVDTNFNERMYNAIQTIISEPEPGLPITERSQTVASSGRPVTVSPVNSQRFGTNHSDSGTNHLMNSVGPAAGAGTDSGDVHDGAVANEPILGGVHATAGTGFTQAIDLVLRGVNGHSNPQALLDAQAIDNSLNSIMSKLLAEDFAVACGMHILQTIKHKLRSSLDLTMSYFTPATLTSFSSLNGTSISDIGKNLTPTQVRLLVRQKDSYIRQLQTTDGDVQFIPMSPTDMPTRSAILTMLAKSSFRETTNAALRYRLLTVGIPSGFSKNLVERINGNSINSTTFRTTKASEVIYFNVYKRSIEYPQIIFKPKKYIFDISLFSTGYSNLNIQDSDTFESVLQRISLFDYQSFQYPETVRMSDIITSEKYSFIANPTLRRSIIENHVMSDLFSEYIRVLTGMKLAEDTFIDQQSQTYRGLSLRGDSLTPQFESLARKYLILKREIDMRSDHSLQRIPEISFDDMLTSPLVDEITKDDVRLLKFGNLVFKSENAFANLLSPKLFDRVFTIPLNVDDFEIDYTQTISTAGGREFIEKAFVQARLDRTAPEGVYRFVPRSIREMVFEDYFVTVELVE